MLEGHIYTCLLDFSMHFQQQRKQRSPELLGFSMHSDHLNYLASVSKNISKLTWLQYRKLYQKLLGFSIEISDKISISLFSGLCWTETPICNWGTFSSARNACTMRNEVPFIRSCSIRFSLWVSLAAIEISLPEVQARLSC